MDERLDYGQRGVWDELADMYERRFEVRPNGSFGHVTCGPEWSWRFRHTDYDFWLVLGGHGRALVAGSEIAIAPGTLLVLRPGEAGTVVQDPDDRLTVTYTHFDFVVPGTSDPVDVPASCLPSRVVELGDVRAVGDPLLSVVRLREYRDPLATLEVKFRLGQILMSVYRQDAESVGLAPNTLDPRIQAVMRYVRDRPSSRPTITEAAGVARMSPSQLRRLFRREVGTSFRSFLIRSRMEAARNLLRESTMSISEIARTLGYSDVVLFSRQMRHHFGKSPTAVRRSGS